MFEMGFYLGLTVAILAMIFIPWKCCGRQNIRVAKLSTSTNIQRLQLPNLAELNKYAMTAWGCLNDRESAIIKSIHNYISRQQ